jgi:hypothetical protein
MEHHETSDNQSNFFIAQRWLVWFYNSSAASRPKANFNVTSHTVDRQRVEKVDRLQYQAFLVRHRYRLLAEMFFKSSMSFGIIRTTKRINVVAAGGWVHSELHWSHRNRASVILSQALNASSAKSKVNVSSVSFQEDHFKLSGVEAPRPSPTRSRYSLVIVHI